MALRLRGAVRWLGRRIVRLLAVCARSAAPRTPRSSQAARCGLTRGFSHIDERVAEAPLVVPRRAGDSWLLVSARYQAGWPSCPSWQPWTVRRCYARPRRTCMRGTCAPSASRRRLPKQMPSLYIVRTDGCSCLGALGACHRHRRRHFFVGSGRRGDGLRGARGLQRLEAHAYHTRPAGGRGGSLARLLPAARTRRGGAPRPSLRWSRAALVPRYSRSTPTTARQPPYCTRGGGVVACESYSTPPVPRATTGKRLLLFLVCLCTLRGLVQNRRATPGSAPAGPCG